ncbi:putative ferredoxin--NADP(+) reductase [Gordonia effusa NBRC 100432]|uniref:ferredoxin--NADP(+) reductase n=1 Tax=Gordonia effusa NBRC 100432 TaxID=1077974 RepID=H0QWA3_9ACTN|nr:FAD-dependent oxidoreductase [Gordonia effusa]GAB17104.1 putative ferredoxin--NADP(+) reductase [Gordonia effusa NBRC 100432]
MFVITQSCCSDAACVAVCPVDCIHPTPEERGFGSSDILHIDPQACIDCGACADACPVDAIFPADRLGTRDKVFIDINASYYRDNANAKPDEAGVASSGAGSVASGPSVSGAGSVASGPSVSGAGSVASGPSFHGVVYPALPKLRAGMRVAIVGTGPSGGYALRTILDRTQAHVTVIDKLPTPGGLVRAGVAPDHPSTKNVMKAFDILYRDPRVTMATNVTVGTDTAAGEITPAELAAHFDAVFYCVGASESRRLGIPGEELPGSTSATDLVAWYNAVPGASAPPIPRHGAGRVVIVGTGNVALDVARILVSPPELLATTDIADRALAILADQNVHEVVLLGRRGQADAAYTDAEYRALESIPGVEVVVHVDPSTVPDLSGPADPARRRIIFLFHSSPEKIVGNVAVERVSVTSGARTHDVAADLMVRSIGYRSVPIGGLPFDDARGVFPNNQGRLLDVDGAVLPGQYVIGWAKRGPSGGIGTNKLDAITTVEDFLDDAVAGRLRSPLTQPKAFAALLKMRRARVIGYRGMRSIDRAERARGASQGRPRVKFTRVADMVKAAGWRKS